MDGGATAAIVGAGVSAASTGAQISMAGKMNQRAQHEAWRTREWQTKEREASQAWQLEQWNRQNVYNSPAEQLKRSREAGINPLAVINGEFRPSDSGMPSGAQAPSGSQAQLFNPMDGVDASGIADNILRFKQYELAKKQTDAQIKRMDYQNDKDRADTMTRDLLRGKEVELIGANIKMTLANEKLTTQEVQNKIQEVLESQQRVNQSIAQVEYLQGQSAYLDLMRLIESQRWPKEKKIMAQQLLNMQTQRVGMREDNIHKYYDREKSRHELEEYYENGTLNRNSYYGRNLYRQDEMQDLQHQNLINQTKDPILGTVDKVTDSLKGIADVVSSFANSSAAIAKRGVSLRSVSNKQPQTQYQGPSSVHRDPNPLSSIYKSPFW